MKYSDVLDQLPIDRNVKRAFGEPFETSDGATVIPVARIRAGKPRSDQDGDQGINAVPLGVFVIHGGKVSWVAAVDADRVALIGVLTGLLAAVIGTLAVLRQPPWPRMTITITENR